MQGAPSVARRVAWTRRRIVAGGLAAGATAALAACGAPSQEAAPAGGPAKASGSIRFSFFGTIEEKAVWEKIAQDFAAKNPGVTVTSEHIPSDYFTKIQTAIAGGDAADAI